MSSNNEDSSIILGQTSSTSPLSEHNGRRKRKSPRIAAFSEATSRNLVGQLKDDGRDNGSDADEGGDKDDDIQQPKKKQKKTGK